MPGNLNCGGLILALLEFKGSSLKDLLVVGMSEIYFTSFTDWADRTPFGNLVKHVGPAAASSTLVKYFSLL